MIVDMRAEVAACRLCPRMAPHAQWPSGSFGTTSTGYMLLGEAPDHEARPFDGQRGGLLREALTDVGDPRYQRLEDLFFLADAVRCRPVDSKDASRTRPPSSTECRECHYYLDFELRALHPRLVLAVGAVAARSVLNEPVQIEKVHGRRHILRGTTVLPLLLPSAANRAAFGRLGLTLATYRRWLTGLFGTLIEEI
jgi:DNA polymerase